MTPSFLDGSHAHAPLRVRLRSVALKLTREHVGLGVALEVKIDAHRQKLGPYQDGTFDCFLSARRLHMRPSSC